MKKTKNGALFSYRLLKHRIPIRRKTESVVGTREARLLVDLATRQDDFSDTATALLAHALERTGAISTGLFRAVHDTGLLVPFGRPSFAKPDIAVRLTNLMARAADQAATAFLSSPKASLSHRHTGIYRRRTTAQGGFVIWSTVLIAPPLVDDQADGTPPDIHQRSLAPQVLGVWVSISEAKEPVVTTTADIYHAPSKKARPQDIAQTVHPLFQLLLQQISLREAATSARRQTEKRLREVATIYEIGRAIDRIDIDDLFNFITQKAADVMDAQACSLMLINNTTDQLYIAASCGLPDEVVENTRILIGQGIAGRVAQTGEALLVQSDARSDPRFKGARGIGLPGISSSITMPMMDEHRQVKGVLSIRRRTPSAPFTEDDKRLFSIFATQAALAIKNARLYRELRSRVQELQTLSSLTETISLTLDLDFVLNQVADNLISLVGFDRCLLYLRDDSPETPDRFTVKVSRGFENAIADLPATDDLIFEITSRLIPILMEEGDHSLPLAINYAKSMRMRSFFAQPVIVRGMAIGVLVVTNDISRRPIAYSNLDLLSTFLQHAGIAIENARLYAQMERRVNELHTLYTMSRSLTTTYGLSRACATVASVSCDILAADAVLLLLFNDRLDTLRIRETKGLTNEISDALRFLPDATEISPLARSLREPLQRKPSGHKAFDMVFGARWKETMESIAAQYPSLLLVPMVTEDTVVGFLILGRATGPTFRPEETKLVAIISSQAGSMLRGAALYEQSIEQRVLELSALYELSKKVRSARSLSDALDAILDIVSSVIWCEVAEIFTVDKQRGLIVRQAQRGDVGEEPGITFDAKRIPAWVLQERKALLIADVTSDKRFVEYVPQDAPTKSLMAIPVFLGDEVLAVLQVQAAVSGLYNEDNVKMLSLIAAQAAALFRDMESLRELTTYTDNILRSIAAGVVTLDSLGEIVTMNLAAERLLRVKYQDMSGRAFEELLDELKGEPSDIDDIRKMVALAVDTGQIIQRHRLRLFWEDLASSARGAASEDSVVGEPVVVNGSASQLLSERGEYLGVVLVFEDITKEDEMEQELSRMSRLAEIGQLAAGIAHELRNPLASIKGAAQVLLGDLSEEMVERHGEFLDIIVNEVDGLNATTSEFLEFSRPTPPCVGPVAVNALLSRRIGFMRPEIKQMGVTIDEEYDAELPDIQADGNQLERVFLNIILNAIQAMPDGGKLFIQTRRGTSGMSRESKEGTVEVRFRDSGLGIPESRRDKIFAPFFTTKTKGTGLGLSIVQKIIDSHGGQVHVDSVLGEGTTFVITLPVASPFTQRLRLQGLPSAELSEQRNQDSHRKPVHAWLQEPE